MTEKQQVMHKCMTLTSEKDELVHTSSVQIDEIERLKGQLHQEELRYQGVCETSRTSQKESAARLVEFSLKNSKLASEVSSLKMQFQTAQQNLSNTHTDVTNVKTELDQYKQEMLEAK